MAELLQEQGAGGSMMSGPAGGGPSFEAEPGGLLTHPVSAGLLNLPLFPLPLCGNPLGRWLLHGPPGLKGKSKAA